MSKAHFIVAVAVLASAGCATSSQPCAEGKLVDSESGPICVFRRDSALVIEGGFECPSSFGHRFDTERAIACSQRPIQALPSSLCVEIGDGCDTAMRLRPDTASDGDETNVCQQTCAVPADCVPGGDPLPVQDEDNFACNDGVCEDLGCNDDAECAGSFAEPEMWNCRAVPGVDSPRKQCVELCDDDADCGREFDVTGHSPFSCVDQVCAYTGCVSDEACGESWVCADRGEGAAYCYLPCETVADCQAEIDVLSMTELPPSWGDVSWACVEGYCETYVTGCDADADCDTGNDGTFRCDIR